MKRTKNNFCFFWRFHVFHVNFFIISLNLFSNLFFLSLHTFQVFVFRSDNTKLLVTFSPVCDVLSESFDSCRQISFNENIHNCVSLSLGRVLRFLINKLRPTLNFCFIYFSIFGFANVENLFFSIAMKKVKTSYFLHSPI